MKLHSGKVKIEMENGPGLKMYLLLKLVIVHCYISLPQDNHVGKKQRSFRKSVVLVEILPTCATNLVFVLHTSKLFFFFFFFINIIYYSFRGLFCKKTVGKSKRKGPFQKERLSSRNNPLILTFDPNFLGHPSRYRRCRCSFQRQEGRERGTSHSA